MKDMWSNETISHHEATMMKVAKPEGLLPLEYYKYEHEYKFSVDEGNYSRLVWDKLKADPLSKLVKNLLKLLVTSMSSCQEYLLDFERLRIHRDKLFINSCGEYYLLYLPYDCEDSIDFELMISSFLNQLLVFCTEDEDSQDLLNQLLRYLSEGTFNIETFIDLFYGLEV